MKEVIFILPNDIRALHKVLLMYLYISHDVVSATKPLMNKHFEICRFIYVSRSSILCVKQIIVIFSNEGNNNHEHKIVINDFA